MLNKGSKDGMNKNIDEFDMKKQIFNSNQNEIELKRKKLFQKVT